MSTTKKTRIVLHIGTEKTGTTALQYQLFVNRAALEKQGFYYYHSPDRVDARAIASATLGDGAQDDYLRQLSVNTPDQRKEFKASVVEDVHTIFSQLPENIHTVLISSEHFHSRLRHKYQMQWLLELLTPLSDDIKVIVYLRRQMDMATSFYSTQLKNGSDLTLLKAVEVGCRFDNHYYNYEKFLSLWVNSFGESRIMPRLFVKGRLVNNNIIDDFSSLMGIDMGALSLDAEQSRHNESLLPFGQWLLRGLNELINCGDVARQQLHCSLEEVEIVRRRIRSVFVGKGERLSFSKYSSLQDKFYESNERVRERWFPSEDELFDTLSPWSDEVVLVPLNSSQLELTYQAINCFSSAGKSNVKSLDACAIYLRDAALSCEVDNLKLAIKHMELAWLIRPEGPVINRKLGEYSIRLSSWSQRLKNWMCK